jgi:cation:H+ antiporter
VIKLPAELAAMLLLILAASELFTNALEHLGARLKMSEGVTGSLFAAAGTALPETIISLMALVAGTKDIGVNEEISVGAILGAPLMISTLSTGLIAFAVLGPRGASGLIKPEATGLARDLNHFLFAFGLAAIAMFVPVHERFLRGAISGILILTYATYAMATFRASAKLVEGGHGTAAEQRMFLERAGLPRTVVTMLLQLGIALAGLVLGAQGFIHGAAGVSRLLGVSPLLLSLLIIPVATELPEKLNSLRWIRRGKDTLALGNLTGAMVFQGTLLPAVAIMLTPWQPRIEVLTGVLVTLGAATWLRLHTRAAGLHVWMLMVNGCLYLVYLAVAFSR